VEIQDWRAYQPGDDVRSIDWNAVARTGELILRLREDEISPRVEVVLDASRSMAVQAAKAARAQELALLFCELAGRQGLQPVLVVCSAHPQREEGVGCAPLARRVAFDARDDLDSALARSPPLRRCGLRLVVSDFLFETSLDAMAGRLARDVAALGLVQVLATEDGSPVGGFGARLVDSESEQVLERLLDDGVLNSYLRRFQQHQSLLKAAAHRARALLATTVADRPLEQSIREDLFPLVAPARAEVPWPWA
jgi:uncharacterized protein (DUF58 family)